MTTQFQPLPNHPLTSLFERAAESLTTSLGEISKRCYRGTTRKFLRYLGEQFPDIMCLEQLQRDPHILGWLAMLRLRTPPFSNSTLCQSIIHLRRLFEELAWTQQTPALTQLLKRDDIPRKHVVLPRALTPEQDRLIQNELLRRRNDLLSTVLLLQRHTGMRIGECADLSLDCLRPLGPDQWAIHVPLGKLKTERLVPVDSFVCQLVDRLRTLRAQYSASPNSSLLTAYPHDRQTLIRNLRATLQHVVATVGITTRIVPHQFRHTYASEMLRGGVSFPAVMKLLGHTAPAMTMAYLDITHMDLQRECQLARSQPRHLAPLPRGGLSVLPPLATLPTLIDSLRASQHVLEMFRRTTQQGAADTILRHIANRLTKIISELLRLA